MDRDKIIFFRNFFLAAFIIGLLFALFYFGATVSQRGRFGFVRCM